MPKEREFIVWGRVTLNGVSFTVKAKDSQEAIEKVKAGDWDAMDTIAAETVDWTCRNEAEENV